METIDKAPVYELVNCLVSFDQPRNKTSFDLLRKILEKLEAKVDNLLYFDFISMFQNLNNKGLASNPGAKSLTLKIIELLSNRIDNFSLKTHVEVIKYGIHITDFNPKEYYNSLCEFY